MATKKEKKNIPETEEMISPSEETATVTNWEEKANEYLDDLKRSQADFENYKKRLANDRTELSGHLIKGIVSDLVPILDNFHSATEHVPPEAKDSPWVTGITYIEKQFEDTLKNYGVEPLAVKPGDPFDPSLHEAVEMKEGNENTGKKHAIVKVLQKGYKIGDKVMRPARVIVT